MQDKRKKRDRRKRSVRAKIYGTGKRPRLSVFRSNKYIYAQIIDDEKEVTLVAASEKDLELPKGKKGNKKEGKMVHASKVGEILTKKALKKGIKKVAFDRGPFHYHGRVKALAESARKGGLKF